MSDNLSRCQSIRATYRMQFRPDFPLEEAARLAGYLARLGVSHLYASPYLQATPGSTHGYDGIHYGRVNRELGGEDARRRLVKALEQAGLGQVLDIVPNHMAIHPENPWWWDVLENGPSSRFAAYFDVEWDPPEARHSNAVLLPVLGDHYGRILEAGEVRLEFHQDAFTVRYHEHVFPVDPCSLGGILSAAAERSHSTDLAFLAGAYEGLPSPEEQAQTIDYVSANRRYRDKEVLRRMLGALAREQPAIAAAIQQVVAAVNADTGALDAFLRRQNYRLALWKISAGELGYRRFFDINSMIGLRVEDQEVFDESHALIMEWIAAGEAAGLRIDHPDGLLDPLGYFDRLRVAAEERGRPDAWIVVEKILEPGEELPPGWPVDGTSGYDFLNRVNGLFVNARAEEALTEFYADFTGETSDYPELVREMKLQAATELLGPDLNRLTELLLQVCERHPRFRDYTRRELRGSLAELAACLPVYRTYIRPQGGQAGEDEVLERDRAYLDEAVAAAKRNRPDLDPRLFDFLCDLFLLRIRGSLESELVERFQQFSGPVMAKGVEDTTFYRFNRFVSLNEVGGSPGLFGTSPATFHQACQETLARFPYSMLTTSTHDTKRSEDVRARLNVLSEIPGEWMEAVRRWSAINEPYRGAPAQGLDRNTEYLFYQVVVGAWPLTVERSKAYMEKAVREAKQHTSWTVQNTEYEAALTGFVEGALNDQRFVQEVEAFVARIRQAGWVNSLAQTLIKLTTPGIPDLYQGNELWDYSLVDPDNRRPVDYALRERLLEGLSDGANPEQVWQQAETGLPKMWLIRQALALRAEHPDWFGAEAAYTPLTVDQAAGVAFLRGERVAVVVPRLPLVRGPEWSALNVNLPAGRWRNMLTGEDLEGGAVALRGLFARFPAALLVREG